MIFLVAPWNLTWNQVAVATDACESGFGICTARLSHEEVSSIGRLPERERY